MRANFDLALKMTLKFEGGFVDNVHDPGGATNMGITLATLAHFRNAEASASDIRGLSPKEAADIYLQLYWLKIAADNLPTGLDIAMFDFSVNSGPEAAVRCLQKNLNITVDGIFGPNTLTALSSRNASDLIQSLTDERVAFLRNLTAFRWFGRGWLARVMAIQQEALRLAVVA